METVILKWAKLSPLAAYLWHESDISLPNRCTVFPKMLKYSFKCTFWSFLVNKVLIHQCWKRTLFNTLELIGSFSVSLSHVTLEMSYFSMFTILSVIRSPCSSTGRSFLTKMVWHTLFWEMCFLANWIPLQVSVTERYQAACSLLHGRVHCYR